jgi:radical SAM protein with 4Fe4S-binding SPASM domain
MIQHIQIDHNGLCNAKCWFCPVAYEGNPKKGRTNMSIETLEKILKQISDGRGDFVSNEELFAYPAHYSELVLHPQFEEILATYSKYNISMYLFSNAIAFTPDKIDIVKKYSSSIEQIVFNIPSSNREQWSRFMGVNVKLFDKTMNNLKYANDTLNELTKDKKIELLVNGVTNDSSPDFGGITDSLINSKQENLDVENEGDVIKAVNDFSKMFPKFSITDNLFLKDRAGALSDLSVISNGRAIEKHKVGKVVACSAHKIKEWVSISAAGDVFICCEDFYFETVFGNIHEKTIKDIWYSQEHKDMIKESMSGLCTKCVYAVWKS